MAKSSKNSSNKSRIKSAKENAAKIVDADDASTSEADPFSKVVNATKAKQSEPEGSAQDDIAKPAADDPKQDDSLQDAEVVEAEIVDPRPEEVTAEEDCTPEIEPDSPEINEPIPPQEPVTASSPTADKTGGGFVPLVLGGAVAGIIGYGIATYTAPADDGADLNALIAQQAEQISALEARLDQPAEAPDFSPIEAQIEAVGTDLATFSQDVDARLNDLQTRMVDFERQPNADGTLSDTALAIYQQELEDLRAELDAQKEDVMSAAAQAEADLAAARAEAAELEAAALEAAEAAAARAALNRVAAAVETGAPFADALSDLDADIPAVLSDAAESGVATTAQLTDEFPAAARSALAVARAEGVSDDAGGIGGFFRNQFDVRSTTPQEGDGPDAVLSRAEAAAKEGRIADALAEIDALPEVARAEITDWTARAQQRADVLNAIATLSETYN